MNRCGNFGGAGLYSFVSYQQYQSFESMYKHLCCSLSAKYLAICNESHSLLLRPDINDSVLTEAKSGSACNFIVQKLTPRVQAN